MAIEQNWWPWKPTLFNQYRVRIKNELRLAQREEHCRELRHQIDLVEQDIKRILQHIKPIDSTDIDQKLHSCFTSYEKEQQQVLEEYDRVKQYFVQATPKLLIGNAYLYARDNEYPIKVQRQKQLKLKSKEKWKKGIGDVYRKLQIQRDQEDQSKHHQSVNPLPPSPIDEIIIPFQTPPLPPNPCRLRPSDSIQLAVDDTIVKPRRLVNKTLQNISHMSFHIDPDQCSSPKSEDKKKKTKLKNPVLPPRPPPPVFSSTAIFDAHAFFTQMSSKTKKQKKKIDISRQPMVMMTDNGKKKQTRTKKFSPYEFQDEEMPNASSKSKGVKLLADDIITARFAKNSHHQSHQTSMASTKSSKSRYQSNQREHRKKKTKNILGIGASSPSISSTNITLSPGRLSTNDKDDECDMKSSLSRRHNRTKSTNKSKRTRVK